MKPAQYLDAAKTALLLSTDYELAKIAGISTGQVSETRYEKRLMPQPLMIKVAKALNLEFGQVYLDLKRQRKSAVPDVARQAAMLMLAVFLGANAPGDAHANDTSEVSSPTLNAAPLQGSGNHAIGIMSSWLRRTINQIAALARSTFAADPLRFGFADW